MVSSRSEADAARRLACVEQGRRLWAGRGEQPVAAVRVPHERHADDGYALRPMSWDALLPIAGVALGYLGSLHTEARRDRRASRQAILARRTEVEQEALLELQDLLLDLPTLYREVVVMYIKVRAEAESGRPLDPHDDVTLPGVTAVRRAKVLASRVVDDTLRDQINAAINAACPDLNTEIAERYSVAGGYQPLSDAWMLAENVNEAIGERLRSPLSSH